MSGRSRMGIIERTDVQGGQAMANKDKGGKQEKKQPKKNLKEKRAEKKQKKAKG